MQFITVAALFVAGVFAAPSAIEARTGGNTPLCPNGLYSNPTCCAADVLGIAGINCHVPQETPRDGRNFREICARTGDQALCCVLGLAGQDLLCNHPVGLGI